jgi:hypothetical protein
VDRLIRLAVWFRRVGPADRGPVRPAAKLPRSERQESSQEPQGAETCIPPRSGPAVTARPPAPGRFASDPRGPATWGSGSYASEPADGALPLPLPRPNPSSAHHASESCGSGGDASVGGKRSLLGSVIARGRGGTRVEPTASRTARRHPQDPRQVIAHIRAREPQEQGAHRDGRRPSAIIFATRSAAPESERQAHGFQGPLDHIEEKASTIWRPRRHFGAPVFSQGSCVFGMNEAISREGPFRGKDFSPGNQRVDIHAKRARVAFVPYCAGFFRRRT